MCCASGAGLRNDCRGRIRRLELHIPNLHVWPEIGICLMFCLCVEDQWHPCGPEGQHGMVSDSCPSQPWAGKPPWTGHPQLAASLPQRGFKNIFPVDSSQPGVGLIDSAIQVHSRFIYIIHICSIQFFIFEHPLLPDEMPSLLGSNLQNIIFSEVMLTSRWEWAISSSNMASPLHGTA